MPRVIASTQTTRANLEETVAAVADGFDPRDDYSILEAAEALERLANNREFLGNMMIAQLGNRYRDTFSESAYSPQALVLSRLRSGCFLRANIWPSPDEAFFRASGAHSFVYGVPHDHNFSFLTVGYFGPGYRSDYYEIDYDQIAGFHGEHVDLRFAGHSVLHEGKLMLYRAHVDVHSQLPPEATSVSLNLVHVEAGQEWFDQYGFDLDSSIVTGVLNPSASETFLRCAVAMGGAEALGLAAHFGRHHPSDRMRVASFEARAAREDAAGRDALWREAELSGSVMLAAEAKLRRIRLFST